MVYHTYEEIVGKQSILRAGAIAVDAEVIKAPNDSIGNTNEVCVLWVVGNRAIRMLDVEGQVLNSNGSSLGRVCRQQYRQRSFQSGCRDYCACQTPFNPASRTHFVSQILTKFCVDEHLLVYGVVLAGNQCYRTASGSDRPFAC